MEQFNNQPEIALKVILDLSDNSIGWYDRNMEKWGAVNSVFLGHTILQIKVPWRILIYCINLELEKRIMQKRRADNDF